MKGLLLVPLVLVAAVPAAAVAPAGEARSAADCSVRSTGLIPLTDLGKGRYRGQPGGLYPNGANRPGRRYQARGLVAARKVRPIRGKIGVVGIGMAGAMDEFKAFARGAAADPDVNRSLAFVDGPGAGWDAVRVARRGSRFWGQLRAKVRSAQLTPRQVQVIWLKQAIAGEDRAFPQGARALQLHLRTIVRTASREFPNLRLVYVSSWTYGGYASTHVSPEPFAYETGFAAKWLVADGISGRLGRKVWVGWGPYLWTDGLVGRRDGLTWTCDDVAADGTHPSASGVRKVVRLLSDFFTADATARPWFAPTKPTSP